MKVQMFFKKQLAFCLAMAMIVGPAAAADTVNAAGDPEMGIVQSEDILSSSSESRRTMADELEAHTYPAAAHSINLSWSAAENAARTAELSDQENGVLIDEDSHPLWRFTVESNGLYALEMTYSIPGDSGNNPSFSMLVDGESPYQEAENITVYRKWQDMGEITVNTLGDEVRPDVVEIKEWQTALLWDQAGLYETPLLLNLAAGEHSLSLAGVSRTVVAAELRLVPYTEPEPYREPDDSQAAAQTLTFQAEDIALWKNDATIRIESDGDPACKPIAYGSRVFNTVGGYRWRKANQTLTLCFTVPQSGYYQIGFRFIQSWNDGLPSYRQILIDDEVPCQELMAYRFEYRSTWQTEVLSAQDKPMLFYLSEGEHTITMRVVMGELSPIIQSLYRDMEQLSDALLSITKLTGNDPDPNYDYQFFRYIPGLEGTLQELQASLEQKAARLLEISGVNNSMTSSFSSVAKQLQSLLKDPFSIARRYSQLVSAQSSLGVWYLSLQSQPLLLDEVTLAPEGQTVERRSATLWQRLKSAWKSFLVSFQKDYNNIGGSITDSADIKDSIQVWVARGNEWAEIIKELSDASFTQQSGTLVNLRVVPASQLNSGSANVLLLAMVSGTAPDVALGVSSQSPVEFAIRDAAVDLSQFEDYDSVVQRFLPELMVPLEYKGGIYALPETMNFNCIFYRTDVLDKYGIPVPETREQLYEQTLPLLYQQGLEFFQSQDFTQFLYQEGASYYTEDGLKSALDTKEAYRAFEEYTQMFTQYGSPVSADFFNRFRTGEMPIGVGGYSLYIQLCTSAPELVGKWGIAPMLGTQLENGDIDRSTGGLAAECCMLLNTRETAFSSSWEFVKWWTSTDTQRQFAREIEALIGVEARWNTANQDAFFSLDWQANDIKVFEEQLPWMREMPVVLGGYYTSRYLTNAFTDVVVSGVSNSRDALEAAVKEINRELAAKQEENGVK